MAIRGLSLGLTLGVALVGFGGLHYAPGAVAAGGGWGGYQVPAKRVYFRPVAQRMNRSHVTATRWRPQAGYALPRYGYTQPGRYAKETAGYRNRSVPVDASSPVTHAGGWEKGDTGQGFRPGRMTTDRGTQPSASESAAQLSLHRQFRPASKARKPTYEELQARNSVRGYNASRYNSYSRNVAVPQAYYGSQWRNW